MRLVLRSLVVLGVGIALSFGLYHVAEAEVGGLPFGPGGIRPGFIALMGVWRALGGSAPSLGADSMSGAAPLGGPADRGSRLTAADGVQLAKAASDGGRYAILLVLGTFIGIVVEVVWRELARPAAPPGS